MGRVTFKCMFPKLIYQIGQNGIIGSSVNLLFDPNQITQFGNVQKNARQIFRILKHY